MTVRMVSDCIQSNEELKFYVDSSSSEVRQVLAELRCPLLALSSRKTEIMNTHHCQACIAFLSVGSLCH